MEINNIHGANPYANARPAAESNLVQEQNQEAAQADLNQESTRAVQEAFEVNITQEAREQQAAASEEAEETQLPEPVQAAAAEQEPARQPSQIVNIVA
ncbi:MAG: hypothetical protein MI863_01820 [Desulfobacterales bacterium]|nr:hypothetical protein [Desulfobacterales bacterium]